MLDTVLPAPPTIEAFVKGLAEPVEARPAEELFDGALNAVEEKKPKGSTDVHTAAIKLVKDFEACRRLKNVHVLPLRCESR